MLNELQPRKTGALALEQRAKSDRSDRSFVNKQKQYQNVVGESICRRHVKRALIAYLRIPPPGLK